MQELVAMHDHDVANGAQLASTIAPGVGESHWPQPELGLAVGSLDMDMGRLRTITREKVEAVRPWRRTVGATRAT